MSLYSLRGVSAQKEDVHNAIRNLNHGLYPHSFCQLFPDFLGNDDRFVNLSHADGAGSKSILAYLYWKETGDISVWKGIAQDAIVMNLDDLLCVGIYDNILFSSTIDRNKKLIPAEVIEALIEGSREFIEKMAKFGVNIHYLGGETADVGDVVRTVAVNGNMSARWPKEKLITNNKIAVGDVIIGLSSSGIAVYEDNYNSGLGSNGLSSARHDVLSKHYAEKYPETFEPTLDGNVVYIGKNKLTETIAVSYEIPSQEFGQLLLSPTRTYAPVIKTILDRHFNEVHGLIHCSGGGQTKCMKYLPGPMKIVKDNLFDLPVVFRVIQQNSHADNKEMFQVFNMGHRMELFTSPDIADKIIKIAKFYNIEAKIIGRVEPSDKKELVIRGSFGEVIY